MSSKALHIICACVCCVFCVGIICATVSITGSFREGDAAEELAQVYALQYEDALQKYTGFVPSSVSSNDNGTINSGTEIIEPAVDGTTKPNTSEKTTEGSIPSSTAEPSNSTNPPSLTGGNGSSAGSSHVDELPDNQSGDKDEAKDTPESGTLPNYTEYCVKDANGHWVYIVKRGDTLSRISGKVGFSVQELAEYNHIENVNLIYTNQSIKLPCAAGCDCSFCG